MNLLDTWQRFYTNVIAKAQFYGVVKLAQLVFGKDDNRKQYLLQLPKESTGYQVAALIEAHNFDLIPGYESHDLKHLLFDFGMTVEDEIAMQWLLIGNGNYTPPTLLFALLGLGLPSNWRYFKQSFIRGRKLPSVWRLNLKDCADIPLLKLKEQYQLR